MGISRRLILSICCLVLGVVILFLVFLKHYAPKQLKVRGDLLILPASVDTSESLIEKINKKQQGPIIPLTKLHDIPLSSRQRVIQNSIPKDLLKEGSNASISVYHHAIPSAFSTTYDKTPVISGVSQKAVHAGGAASALNKYNQQNMQSEKSTFIQDTAQTKKTRIQSTLQKPISPYTMNAGTIIPATLMTGVNSDLPGSILAKVRRDVFDSVTGNYLLIPQGTTIVGQYDSQVAYGQSRVLMVWSRLIFPNGSSFDLKGMPGADLSGMSGLHDKVNNHYARIFGSALMFSVFGAVGQLTQPKNNSSQLTSQQIIYGAVGQQMSQTAMQLVARNMNIQPTVMIRSGDNFNVLLTRDLVLPRRYPD